MNEFLETTHDKFVFQVKDDYLYSRDDSRLNLPVAGITKGMRIA
jgi:hypothetical protein